MKWLSSSTLTTRWQSWAMLSYLNCCSLLHTEIKRWTNNWMSVCFNFWAHLYQTFLTVNKNLAAIVMKWVTMAFIVNSRGTQWWEPKDIQLVSYISNVWISALEWAGSFIWQLLLVRFSLISQIIINKQVMF